MGNVLLGTPAPLFLGIISGLMEVVPGIGPAIALIPGVVAALIGGLIMLGVGQLWHAYHVSTILEPQNLFYRQIPGIILLFGAQHLVVEGICIMQLVVAVVFIQRLDVWIQTGPVLPAPCSAGQDYFTEGAQVIGLHLICQRLRLLKI